MRQFDDFRDALIDELRETARDISIYHADHQWASNGECVRAVHGRRVEGMADRLYSVVVDCVEG